MKPQTLIPLSGYVDKVKEIPKMLSKDKVKLIYDFSDKLKPIPTIADFIPAVYENGKWRVLEEPKPKAYPANDDFDFNWEYDEAEVHQYQTALNNVKFSGWEVSKNDTDIVSIINKDADAIYFDLIYPTYYNGKDAIELKSYSDLTTINLPLTERGMQDFNINI